MANRNQKRKNYKKNTVSSEERTRLFFVRAIAVWIFVLPLIVHFKIVDVPVQMQDLYLREQAVDLFAYWKAVWLWIGATIFFISTLIFRWVYKIGYKPTKQVWALIAFAISIIISYIFSDAKNVALFGYLDRYEGTLSWLSYCMAAYSVHTFATNRKYSLIIVRGIVFSAGIVGLIGAFQFFGLDFFKTSVAKRLILGSNYNQYKDALNFTMPVGQSYSTLYNPNYIGSFVVITLPLVGIMIRNAKNKILIFGYMMIVVSLLISLIGSKSTSGIITLSLIMMFLAINYFLKFKYKYKLIILTLGIVVCTFFLNAHFMQSQIKKITNQFDSRAITNHFTKLSVEGENIMIYTDIGNHYSISPNSDVIRVLNSDNQIIDGEIKDNMYIVFVEDLSYKSHISYNMQNNKIKFLYYYDDENYDMIEFDYNSSLDYFTILNRKIPEGEVKNSKFFANETLFSSRGYIWNRTFPVILSEPVIGIGADVFSLKYPQIDLLDKWYVMKNSALIIDKPHNTYLGLMLNFGIIGTICFLLYVILSYTKRSDFIKFSIIGLCITFLINDSIISTLSVLFIITSITTSISKVAQS